MRKLEEVLKHFETKIFDGRDAHRLAQFLTADKLL